MLRLVSGIVIADSGATVVFEVRGRISVVELASSYVNIGDMQ